jgi:uncharacterized membrane protein
MTQRKNRFFTVLVILTNGASVAVGLITGNLFLSVLLSLVGLSVLILYRRRIEEPIHDERDLLINAKSSTATLQVFLAGTAFLGSALIFLGTIGYAAYELTGYTLLVLTGVGSLIHQVFRDHFSRVYGG